MNLIPLRAMFNDQYSMLNYLFASTDNLNQESKLNIDL